MLAAREAKAKSTSLVVAALQPVVTEIFEISRFALVLDVFGSVPEALARGLRDGPRRVLGAADVVDDRPLLGHARLDAGRARPSAAIQRQAGRGARPGGRPHARRPRRTPGPSSRAELDFAVLAHVRRPHLLRASSMAAGTDYVVCDMGSGARPRPARAREPAQRRAARSTSSCPTCTGTTSWDCRSSCRPTSRATGSRIYGCHERARGRVSPPAGRRRRSRSISTQLGATHRVRAPRARACRTTSPACA